jgi:hypothetical protein
VPVEIDRRPDVDLGQLIARHGGNGDRRLLQTGLGLLGRDGDGFELGRSGRRLSPAAPASSACATAGTSWASAMTDAAARTNNLALTFMIAPHVHLPA